ncbi:MAG TPA: hypothetical protein VJH23_01155 [archaeon]|nr:hypothetical protein [archaeon]
MMQKKLKAIFTRVSESDYRRLETFEKSHGFPSTHSAARFLLFRGLEAEEGKT